MYDSSPGPVITFSCIGMNIGQICGPRTNSSYMDTRCLPRRSWICIHLNMHPKQNHTMWRECSLLQSQQTCSLNWCRAEGSACSSSIKIHMPHHYSCCLTHLLTCLEATLSRRKGQAAALHSNPDSTHYFFLLNLRSSYLLLPSPFTCSSHPCRNIPWMEYAEHTLSC